MERMKPTALLLVGLMGLGSLGADLPATQPTDQSTVAAPTDNSQQTGRNNRRNRGGMGGSGGNTFGGGGNRGNSVAVSPGMEKYAIVEQRSIFIKGNQDVAIYPPAPAKASGPVRPQVRNPEIQRRDEQLLVFNGVIVVDNQANAMVEDQAQLKTYLVQSGDPVSHGRVTAISFDSLTYEANNTSTQVLLGQNLLGEYPIALAAAPAPPTAAPTSQSAGAPPAGSADSGTPTAGAPPAPSGGSSPDDILARLKAKRNQELGIK